MHNRNYVRNSLNKTSMFFCSSSEFKEITSLLKKRFNICNFNCVHSHRKSFTHTSPHRQTDCKIICNVKGKVARQPSTSTGNKRKVNTWIIAIFYSAKVKVAPSVVTAGCNEIISKRASWLEVNCFKNLYSWTENNNKKFVEKVSKLDLCFYP